MAFYCSPAVVYGPWAQGEACSAVCSRTVTKDQPAVGTRANRKAAGLPVVGSTAVPVPVIWLCKIRWVNSVKVASWGVRGMILAATLLVFGAFGWAGRAWQRTDVEPHYQP